MLAVIGQKKSQTQRFLEDGTRIPVTSVVLSSGNVVTQTKAVAKEGYNSVQLGYGNKKKANKAIVGHVKGASLEKAPLFLREIRVDGEDFPEVGTVIKATDVFKPGDIVDVMGVSKGKGYAGGVKRYHFKGGPRTHGQSDRERAPGSIGQTTTPGRVYRGKRMAGRMGHEQVTVQNLLVVDVDDTQVLIKGLVPGPVNNLIMVKKVGEAKKFTPLYQEPKEEEKVEEVVEEEASAASLPQSSDAAQPSEESQGVEPASLSENQAPEESTEAQAESVPISNTSEDGQTSGTENKTEIKKEEKKEEVTENAS